MKRTTKQLATAQYIKRYGQFKKEITVILGLTIQRRVNESEKRH